MKGEVLHMYKIAGEITVLWFVSFRFLHTTREAKHSEHSRARLKRDGTRAETRFGLSEKWTSPFKSAGESVQSTAGSRGVRISG